MTTRTDGRRATLPPPTKTVERWEDVPRFATEEEEARFWAEHELAGEALASMGSAALDDELPPKRSEKGSPTNGVALPDRVFHKGTSQ